MNRKIKYVWVMLAVCMIAHAGFGQSLSFSRVILLPKNVTDTVPAGKVWKIESWTYESEYCGGWNSRPIILQLNGQAHYLGSILKDGNGNIYNAENKGPIWLPAGTTVHPLDPGGCLQAVSIIEFTITP